MRYTTPAPIATSTLLAPERHSFFRYPQVTLRRGVYRPPAQPMGFFSVSTGSSYADTVLKWGFWVGMGLVAHRLYRVLRYDDPFFQFGGGTPAAWEMNPYPRSLQSMRWAKLTDEEVEERREELLATYEGATNLSALARKLDIPVHTAKKWLIESGKYTPSPMGGPRTATTMREAQELRGRIEELREQRIREEFAGFAIARSGEKVYDIADEFGIEHQKAFDWLFREGVNITGLGTISKRQKGKWWKEQLSPEERELAEIAIVLYEGDPRINLSVLAKQLNVTMSTLQRWLRLEGVYY